MTDTNPARTKVDAHRERPGIRVPFTQVRLDDSPGPAGPQPNARLRLYDTSGPGTVPEQGLPALRADWVQGRQDVEPYSSATSAVTPQDLADALSALRERPPLVQCLTNIVVAGWTANVLLAVGAAPAMVDNPHEAGEFAAIAGGVLVNLGTPYDATAAAMHHAVASAKAAGTPWVLDPVAAGGLGWRTDLAHQLLGEARPTIIRGNASEILALAGGAGGRGVESVDSPEAAAEVARGLANQQHSVIAVSGPTDHITDGQRLVRLSNGHPWLTQVTGSGCALGALMAAFAAVVPDVVVAAAAATATLTVAADSAAKQTRGPGSFAVTLLDELALIEPADLADRVRIS